MVTAVPKEMVTKTLVGVTLELSLAEAKTLVTILEFIGGNQVSSNRKFASQIYQALNGAGVRPEPDNPSINRESHSYGGLIFKDNIQF